MVCLSSESVAKNKVRFGSIFFGQDSSTAHLPITWGQMECSLAWCDA